MTFEVMAEDSDVAQARIFLGQPDADIGIVAARSETVDALAEHAPSKRTCSGFPR
ncbi:hypothetical protein P3H15_46950 [Rhodococcus sp. T2V]|uniref:hypothetical protein n=1 Tax=Rhodococcus sp. T2V TaxID=3034164 RepID=UPI0023E187D2|nr:hypothetical protein [Rhodococcus sp. T2V]MDF3312486.1 hypothetical protein [Rhodococcus sp. T2V]